MTKEKMKRVKLNLVGENDSNVVLQYHQQVILEMVTGGKTEKLWKEALANTQFLEGEEVRVANGTMVDFSHFDLMIASTHFLDEDMKSDMAMIKAFWVTLYPFVKRLKEYAHHFQAKYRELAYDQDKTLKNFAEQNLELGIYKKFMSEKMTDEIQEMFKKYHDKLKADSDSKVAEMQKVEAKRQKKHRKRLEKIDEKNRQTTLGHNLSYHITAKDGLNIKH